jgi:hypothetical protein
MRAAHGADDFDHFGHVAPSGFRLTPTVGGPVKTSFLAIAERFFLVLEPSERVDNGQPIVVVGLYH